MAWTPGQRDVTTGKHKKVVATETTCGGRAGPKTAGAAPEAGKEGRARRWGRTHTRHIPVIPVL